MGPMVEAGNAALAAVRREEEAAVGRQVSSMELEGAGADGRGAKPESGEGAFWRMGWDGMGFFLTLGLLLIVVVDFDFDLTRLGMISHHTQRRGPPDRFLLRFGVGQAQPGEPCLIQLTG